MILKSVILFYNHLILSGTKMLDLKEYHNHKFYNHLILSGTKILEQLREYRIGFYNHLILSGTKIESVYILQ